MNRFQPPDANYIELLRFRVRPPKNRELPLQLKATWCVTGNKVELRADILVPGFTSRKLGQIPCEDVSVRFPIPECWIYLFRVEKHFRYDCVSAPGLWLLSLAAPLYCLQIWLSEVGTSTHG